MVGVYFLDWEVWEESGLWCLGHQNLRPILAAIEMGITSALCLLVLV
jgi:hypothetical protein